MSHHSARSNTVHRFALATLILGALLTVAGVVWLWPSYQQSPVDPHFSHSSGAAVATEKGRVVAADEAPCGSADNGKVLPGPPLEPRFSGQTCPRAFVELATGPDAGKQVLLEIPDSAGSHRLTVGDQIQLGRSQTGDGFTRYAFEDFQRGVPLLIWGIVALVALAAVGAWKGLRAVLGIGWALLVVVGFVLPAILDGHPGGLVAIVGASAVLYPILYLVHGPSLKTDAALLGTLAGMLLAAGLGYLAVVTCRLTGLGDEGTTEVQTYLRGVSLSGVLLAGFVIGVMGVLNDVTISQSATVFQLRRLDPRARSRKIFRSAMEVGRDHIASVVYTLVLAYAGSALPLLLLFSVGNRGLTAVLSSDIVAVEVMRSLVGVIALALCVPLTTAVAVLLASSATESQLEKSAAGGHHH